MIQKTTIYLSLTFYSILQIFSDQDYVRLEEIREDLLRGVVKGALIDAYVVAERKDLFEDPSLYIHQVTCCACATRDYSQVL